MNAILLAATVLAPAAQQFEGHLMAPSTTQQKVILAWVPGEVRCGETVVDAAPMRRPWVSLLWSVNPAMITVRYSFNIDPAGRTMGIRHLDGENYAPFSDDIAPSLAATRFRPGMAREGCTIAYLPRQTTLADTPLADLVSYSINPAQGALPEEGWSRIRGSGNCSAEPPPAPLMQAFPDFRQIAATPGVRDWAMIGYDLDANGRPVKVRATLDTGNAALAAASVKAISASRFTEGARQGCLYPYWRAPGTLQAPPAPEEAGYRPAGATCPIKHDWSSEPTLRYPEAFRRRAIEGWAVLSYDVAPWGEVGNIKVLVAEPSDEFGRQATEVIRSAKVATTQGLVGCVDRVRFAMPAPDGAARAGAAGVPPTP